MPLLDVVRSSPFLRRVALVVLKGVSLVNAAVPKDPRRILFYESSNDTPVDNTEALCSWLLQHDRNDRYRYAYCVPDLGGFLDPSRCKRVGRVRGVFEYLRSKYVFYSFGGMRIAPSESQVVVNLWHGTPLKSIGKLTSDESYATENLDDFTVLVAASSRFVSVMAAAFGCDSAKVRPLGYPRCDYLLNSPASLDDFGLSGWGKAVLWMPTFRNSFDGRFRGAFSETETSLPIVETREALCALDEWLTRNGILLVLKSHYYAAGYSLADGLGSIRLLGNREVEGAGYRLYEFVACFDALLTDYSSVFFDYLLLDRPIGFTVDDLENYRENRGFSVDDPLSLMPGELIRDFDDLIGFLADVRDGFDPHTGRREEVAGIAWEHRRGFCERVARECGMELAWGS